MRIRYNTPKGIYREYSLDHLHVNIDLNRNTLHTYFILKEEDRGNEWNILDVMKPPGLFTDNKGENAQKGETLWLD